MDLNPALRRPACWASPIIRKSRDRRAEFEQTAQSAQCDCHTASTVTRPSRHSCRMSIRFTIFKAAVVERGPGLLQAFLPQSATEAAHFRWRGMLPAGRLAQALREETIFVATSR